MKPFSIKDKGLSKTPTRKNGGPGTGNSKDACLSILLDEIQQAVAWSRPSILLAVHRSKNDQLSAIASMEDRLKTLSIDVVHMIPSDKPLNIVDDLLHKPNPDQSIFFIHGFVNQPLTYDGLNLHRELIVEQKLKLILWLSLEEMILLSRRAPDFWAFRHRVIEFPTGRSSRKNNLPSGVLSWHLDDSLMDMHGIHEKLALQERLLESLPPRGDTIASHALAIGNIAYYYWLLGENEKSADLLSAEIQLTGAPALNGIRSTLLNAQAVNSFDRGNYQDALRWIEDAIEISPDHGLLWSNHGVICRSAGQARKSLSSLKRAISFYPSSSKSWGTLGYMYMYLGKYASAIPCLNEALTLHPESIQFYPAVAMCHLQTGKLDELGKVVQRIIDTTDNEYLQACCDGLLRNVSMALHRLQKLLLEKKISPAFLRRDPNIYFILGDSLREIL